MLQNVSNPLRGKLPVVIKMQLLRFEYPPPTSVKKYIAVLLNPQTNREVRVSFGDRRYEQYHDRIGKYKHLDHQNKERRRLYRLRHAGEGEERNKYKAGWFAWHILW